ncbi:helix-turn-helix domain-containing protein [Nonomuraea sp. NPDC049709]|uniref:helix-turn-helix domain-containing protein n=1 Tax=Nonomuraea sp. NPDC049709 TaxID=3154736 RepID=UPI0034171807
MAKPSIQFGPELQRLRHAKERTQAELARAVGCHKSYISRMETGRVSINPDLARQLDEALEAGGALMSLIPPPARRPAQELICLPASTQWFVGRFRELAQLSSFLHGKSGVNICLVTGMAGIGKTALALKAAWESACSFADGTLQLDFGAHTPGVSELSEYDALGTLLRLLNVHSEDIPGDRAGRIALYQSRSQGRRMLIIFDNVRSVSQVKALLPAEPSCRVIVTSRNRLTSLDEAMYIPLAELPQEEAAQLFRAIAGHRAEGAAAPLLANIVAYCGRLPLALRITAARFGLNAQWTLQAFAEGFAEGMSRVDAIDDGDRSIAGAFAMSFDELREADRRLFALLALYPKREIPLSSIFALSGVVLGQARNSLDRLCAANLVSYETADRVVMHDLLREFACGKALPGLAVAERDAALSRLLDHNLTRAEACGRLIDPQRHRPLTTETSAHLRTEITDRTRALDWFETEWYTLVELCKTATVRGFHRRCWQLAFALRDYFFVTKLWAQWIETHQAAVRSARAAGADDVLAAALNSLGIAHVDRGDVALAVGHYQEALELFRRLGDEHGQTSALSNLAWASLYLGDYESALRELRLVLTAYRRLGNLRNAAITLRAIVLAETELAHYRDALEHGQEALTEFQRLDLPLDIVMSLNCIAWAYFNWGAFDAAAGYYQQARQLAEDCGSRYETVRALTGLGNVAAASERLHEALAEWARADSLQQPLEPTVIGEARIRSWLQPSGQIIEVTDGRHSG